VAGNGVPGFSGDGDLATGASLDDRISVALDPSGNLLIADRNNNRIRRVAAATGIISTVVGNGSFSFSGDGGPAVRAGISPSEVAADTEGNLFITSPFSYRVRRVDAATGIISTIVGDGTAGFSGDGGPATSAILDRPSDVALDTAGNLFIADLNNHRIRRVDAVTGVISTVAGNGIFGFAGDGGLATSARLWYPHGVALDVAGNLFIGDFSNGRIRRVDAATGIIDTVAGNGILGFSGDGGPATSASLGKLNGSLALDATGNLFIADWWNTRIRRVDAVTGIITTVAGNGNWGFSGDGGPASSARLNSPFGVAVDAIGNLFIADRDNQRIRRVDAATGVISTVAGNGTFGFAGDGGPATSARLSKPVDVAVDAAGNIFMADTSSNRIRRVRLPTQPPLADLVFAPPLIANASAAFNEIKVGRTIPVKFRLGDGATPEATVTATVAVFRVINISTGSLDTTDLVADVGNANSNSNVFRFNAITQQYIFNLSTKDFPAPATFRIFVTLDDGSQKSVDFSLRE